MSNKKLPLDDAVQRIFTEKLKEQTVGLQPNLVGPDGTKWYLDPAGTEYAQRKDQRGVSMPRANVWVIEKLNGEFKMCLVEDNITRFEGFWVDQIGGEIDRIKAIRYANLFR
jgi:hypothetical protein